MGKDASFTLLVGLALGSFALDQKATAQTLGRTPWLPPAPITAVPPQRPVTNTLTGEVLLPAGRNFVGTRNGRVYVPAGPNGGLIDTRGGGFVPVR